MRVPDKWSGRRPNKYMSRVSGLPVRNAEDCLSSEGGHQGLPATRPRVRLQRAIAAEAAPTCRRRAPKPRLRDEPFLCLRIRLDEVDEGAQRRGNESASREIQEGAREARPPGLEHRLQRATAEIRAQPVLEQVDDACPAD